MTSGPHQHKSHVNYQLLLRHLQTRRAPFHGILLVKHYNKSMSRVGHGGEFHECHPNRFSSSVAK